MAVGLFRKSIPGLIMLQRSADSAYAPNTHSLRILNWRRHNNLAFNVADVPQDACAIVENALPAFVAMHEDDRAEVAGGGALIVACVVGRRLMQRLPHRRPANKPVEADHDGANDPGQGDPEQVPIAQ